jgi:rare lipoprotein A
MRKVMVLIMASALSMPLILHAKQVHHQSKHATKSANKMVGFASFYAAKFNGRRTASGEKFDNKAFTAAHKSLPFGTQVGVTNLRNGRYVVVRINDRGPYVKGRIIDLSKAAARKIGIGHAGVARVKLELISKSKQSSAVSHANMNVFLDEVTKQQS